MVASALEKFSWLQHTGDFLEKGKPLTIENEKIRFSIILFLQSTCAAVVACHCHCHCHFMLVFLLQHLC